MTSNFQKKNLSIQKQIKNFVVNDTNHSLKLEVRYLIERTKTVDNFKQKKQNKMTIIISCLLVFNKHQLKLFIKVDEIIFKKSNLKTFI